jgi:O-antigen/teichoic acid export membrane protein
LYVAVDKDFPVKMTNRNKTHVLDSETSSKDLKRKSIKGGLTNLLTRSIQFGLQIGSTMILARLLTPDDYGVIAMVAVFTGFAEIFSNFGLSMATVQKKDITYEQLSTCFWINLALGICFMGLVMALAPGVSWFYERSELSAVMTVLAFNFFIKGLSIQHNALLLRQMKFQALAVVNITSTLLGIVIALIMAYSGYAYWALVYSVLTTSISNMIGLWIVTAWIPGAFNWTEEVRAMIKFGIDYAVFTVCDYFSKNTDNALIGRFLGADVLGLYSRAYHLLSLINKNVRAPLNRIAITALSRLQNKPDRYRKYCIRYTGIMAFITMPLSVFMFICSEDIIGLVMGAQWTGAAGIFQVFAVTAFIQSVLAIRDTVMVTFGENIRLRKWGIINSIMTIVSFLIGIQWGSMGVAISFTAMTYILLYPSLFYCLRGTPFAIKDFNKAIFIPMVASIITGVICYFLKDFITISNEILRLMSIAGVVGVSYLAIFAIKKSGRNELIDYFSYLKVAMNR